MAGKILLIEDDAATAAYIAKGLGEAGFAVDRAEDGRQGLFLASDGSFAAIVLDRMLPGMEGMAVLSALRAAGIATPVLILSALGTPEDRVRGLTSGADDYLVKPFTFAELLARLNLLIRRAGRVIDLQPREFRLLEFLMRHADQVVTRTMLLEGVWDYHFDPGTNVIDVHISRLRKKIDEGFGAPMLHTVRGAGYRLGEKD